MVAEADKKVFNIVEMNSLDQDNFVIKGRKSQDIDMSKFKTTAALGGRKRGSVKVKKIVGIDDDLSMLGEDEQFRSARDGSESSRKVRSRSQTSSKKKNATWVMPVLIGVSIVLLTFAYVIYSYFRWTAM